MAKMEIKTECNLQKERQAIIIYAESQILSLRLPVTPVYKDH